MSHKFTSYLLIVLLLAMQSFGVNGMTCISMQMGADDASMPRSHTQNQTLNTAQSDDDAPCLMQASHTLAKSGIASDHQAQASDMQMACCDEDTADSCHCPESACGAGVIIASTTDMIFFRSDDKIISVLFSTANPFQSRAKRPPISG
ncbi:hypothetical protein [Paraglaciecola sp. T6c]|uniref:hypothetical protein n=1 Tax=Pseudoalteromonas atlantica (strain T6c / ATCC BAA-1087) TaxID=3042615 RepID=UPI00005C54F0|nr:hypothetical protein [Paraglaciecola sp. T6c]